MKYKRVLNRWTKGKDIVGTSMNKGTKMVYVMNYTYFSVAAVSGYKAMRSES